MPFSLSLSLSLFVSCLCRLASVAVIHNVHRHCLLFVEKRGTAVQRRVPSLFVAKGTVRPPHGCHTFPCCRSDPDAEEAIGSLPEQSRSVFWAS